MNSRKKRGYSRDVPNELLRDYKLFAITCEGGKREPAYFRLFQHLSNRIKVDIIEDRIQEEELKHKYETKSSPKWVLDRAISYVEQEGLLDEDELWFVMDVDKWEKDQIHEIVKYCSEKPNWSLVLSNPCFEIWLFLHKKEDFKQSKSITCNDFKKEVSSFDRGGYNNLNFIQYIKQACENARKIDSDIQSLLPKEKETKVYLMVESIMNFVSIKQFNEFIEDKLPKLLLDQKERLKKSKIIINIK